MNKINPSIKDKIISKVSIGLIVLGIGLIAWTLFTILVKPDFTIQTDYIGKLNAINVSEQSGDERDLILSDDTSKKDKPIEYTAGDYIGSLIIPSLDYELPIYEGTDKDELEKGVGRFIGSAHPGEKDNCVLSGHRDTVFTELADLKVGELVIVNTEEGMFTYEVKNIRIVDKDDKTVIVPTEVATLTLTTCYPFVYIGLAPDRYIVSAELIEN